LFAHRYATHTPLEKYNEKDLPGTGCCGQHLGLVPEPSCVAYLNNTDPFLVNYVQISDFGNKDEKSYQARYDYNFASIGIPGLTFMTRYLTGDNVDRGRNLSEGKEWERNTELMYVFQEGALKNLGVRWRNATVRSNFANDLDENRLIVSYTLPLL